MHLISLLAVTGFVAAMPYFEFVKRQGVTAKISPTAPAPSGCTVSFPSSFGIAVVNLTASIAAAQISDGQIQASGAAVTQITDGQVQAGSAKATVAPVSQISDGQAQAPTATATVAAVSQISDGQIQAPRTTIAAVSQISDGQIQAAQVTVAAVSQISDGQVQAPKSTATVAAVSQISDGQIQAPKSTVGAASQISDGQVQAAATGSAAAAAASVLSGVPVACNSNSTLQLSLAGGTLTDSKGRIGSIVANHQFQFDGPPAQAGAIFTAGWSVCSNGSLALGGSTVFYQCLSGGFFNIYDISIGGQCNAVRLQIVQLVSC